MSSPSSSSSATAGSRRSRRPSRNSLAGPVAAALVAAATVWTPVPFLRVAGPLAAGIWFLAALAAIGLYLAVTPGVVRPTLVGEALNLAALFVGSIGLLVGGCWGDEGGHIGAGVWAASIAIGVAGGTWALQRPSRAWWGLPLSTLVAAGVAIGLAAALTGNTGLCPD